MSYVTEHTVWPDFTLEQPIKDLIARLYQIADTNEPNSGARLSTEVFTDDGSMVTSAKTVTGREAIERSRDDAWDLVSERRHHVLRVYCRENNGRDLMLTGRVKVALRDGNVLESEFAAHLIVDSESCEMGKPRFSKVQVFVDTAPLAAALKAQ